MKVFKIIIFIMLIALISILGYGGGMYFGYFPIPNFVSNQAAKRLGMNEQESILFNKVANLNTVLLNSENKDEYIEFRRILTSQGEEKHLEQFVIKNYKNLTKDTKEKLRKHFGIEHEDFKRIEENLDYAMIHHKDNGKIEMKDDKEIDKLKQKYGFTESFLNKFN